MSDVAFVPIYIPGFDIPIAHAIIDAEDWDRVKDMSWTFANHGYPCNFYAGKRTVLHRFIINAEKGMVVDHINGNPLDARKANLRQCTQAQNCRNSRLRKNNTTGFKGVSFRKRTGRYRAYIMKDGKQINLGDYEKPEDAAAAYNIAADRLHKEFSSKNPIEYSKRPKRYKRTTKTGVPGIIEQTYVGSRGQKTIAYFIRYKGVYLGFHKTLREAKLILDEYKKTGIIPEGALKTKGWKRNAIHKK